MSEPGLSAAARPATAPRELSLRATLLASVLTIVFGVAAGYLGLKVGTTFSASIPAAVMSLAILRGLFRDSTMLESNMVQTQASAGESLMGGVVYIVPALIFVDLRPSVLAIALLTAAGGLLGVFLLVPLRRYFIVSQHGVLPYPEGTACAEILKLGEKSVGHARRVFQGMGVGAVFNLVTGEGLGLFSGQVALTFPRVWGATVGMHLTPLMLGIGFLSGFGVGVTMFAGALLKGLIVIPGCNLASWLQQGHTLSPEELQFQVRMIGVGAVATGGFLAIFRMAPDLRRSLAGGLGSLGAVVSRASVPRTERSLSATTVVTGVAAALGLSVWSLGLLGATNGGGALLAVVLILVLALPFIALSARVVGIVGTSNYPLSGMTIGALLVAVLVLRLAGFQGAVGMTMAIVIGTVVCLSIAISADLSQDLKTGALVGATPRLQQIGEGVAVLLTASIAGVVVMLFQQTGQLATSPAPQARMMAAIVQGVMAGDFQWGLVALGAAVATAAELLGVSAIMLAVGLYLPVPLASAFVVGGALRRRFAVRYASSGEREFLEREGTLLASGLIAGWAVMGVLLVGMVALREVGFLGSVPIGTAQQPEPGLTLSYGRDLISSLIPYTGAIYYFGRVIRLWGPTTAR